MCGGVPSRQILAVSRKALSVNIGCAATTFGKLGNRFPNCFSFSATKLDPTTVTVALVSAALEPWQLAVCPVTITCVEQPTVAVTVRLTVYVPVVANTWLSVGLVLCVLVPSPKLQS